MKVVKLRKSDLNLTLEKLLSKMGLVDGGRAYPDCLHLSKEDEKTLRGNIEKKFKKEYPNLDSQRMKSSVAMYFLNLGPSTRISSALKPGYAVVTEPSKKE